MPVYKYREYSPKFDDSCFIAPSADVIGKVYLAANVSIWFNTVVRGDIEPISIGKGSNIQDCSMLHTSEGFPLNIGAGVTIGHSVVLHSCTVEDNCLIGMGSVILDGAVIGSNSLVAAGSTVPPGRKYPSGSFIMGSPAIAKRLLSKEEREQYGNHFNSYLNYKQNYLDNPITPVNLME